jgi:mitochondrial fission protein ELM1
MLLPDVCKPIFKKEEKTMALTYSGKLGFAKQLGSIIQDRSDDLKKAKVDVEGRFKEITARVETATKEDGKQEALKAELKEQTNKAVGATNYAYSYASDTADLIVGALGKSDELSKRIRKLREQMSKEASRGKKKTA